jgi:hypothetical protein
MMPLPPVAQDAADARLMHKPQRHHGDAYLGACMSSCNPLPKGWSPQTETDVRWCRPCFPCGPLPDRTARNPPRHQEF